MFIHPPQPAAAVVATAPAAALPYANYPQVRRAFGDEFADTLIGHPVEHREWAIMKLCSMIATARNERYIALDYRSGLVADVSPMRDVSPCLHAPCFAHPAR